MQFIVGFIAIALLLEGALELFLPEKVKSAYAELSEDIPVKPMGLMYGFIGVSLNFASRWCVHKTNILIIGIIFFALGFLTVVVPEQIPHKVFGYFARATRLFYIIWGLTLCAAGTVLLFSI
jgi:hypothetical protein